MYTKPTSTLVKEQYHVRWDRVQYVDPAVKALREAGELGWPVDHGRVFASRTGASSVAADSNELPSSRNALPPLMPTGCEKYDILITHARHGLIIW